MRALVKAVVQTTDVIPAVVRIEPGVDLWKEWRDQNTKPAEIRLELQLDELARLHRPFFPFRRYRYAIKKIFGWVHS
jgi:hypothetical protein